MKRELLCCLIGILSLTTCTSPPPDQPAPTIEEPYPTVTTATPTATQPAPTVTHTPTSISTPEVDVYVWLKSDGLLIYSHSGNLCMKDGDADPVFLMPADLGEYDYRLFNDAQTIMLLGWHCYPDKECNQSTHGNDIWRIDRQTGEVSYLTSTFDIEEQLGGVRLPPILSIKQVPESGAFVFNTGVIGLEAIYGLDLYLIDENGQLTILLEPGDGAVSFELSPDGRHIAYISRDRLEADTRTQFWIGLIDTNGGNWRPRLITYDWIATESPRTVAIRPVWRSDSTGFWIAILPPNRAQEDIPNIMTTWYVPVDSDPVQLGSFERPLGLIHAATFSPDGRYVAYAAETEGALHIMQPDGSGDVVYFGEDVSNFDRWEDNTHFIFHTWDSTNTETKIYRGGIGEEPVLIETRALYSEEPVPVPAEGCAP
jgi:hypothetical protein